jgi:hypothetical protein
MSAFGAELMMAAECSDLLTLIYAANFDRTRIACVAPDERWHLESHFQPAFLDE